MNKSGAVFIYVFMLAVLCFFLGYALAPGISETMTQAYTELDCGNSTISNFDKASCTQIDMMAPIFIGLIFGLGGAFLGYMTGK